MDRSSKALVADYVSNVLSSSDGLALTKVFTTIKAKIRDCAAGWLMWWKKLQEASGSSATAEFTILKCSRQVARALCLRTVANFTFDIGDEIGHHTGAARYRVALVALLLEEIRGRYARA